MYESSCLITLCRYLLYVSPRDRKPTSSAENCSRWPLISPDAQVEQVALQMFQASVQPTITVILKIGQTNSLHRMWTFCSLVSSPLTFCHSLLHLKQMHREPFWGFMPNRLVSDHMNWWCRPTYRSARMAKRCVTACLITGWFLCFGACQGGQNLRRMQSVIF